MVGKVSNKGWTVHRRVLELTGAALRYFSQVPKDLAETPQVNRGKVMGKAYKLSIDLAKAIYIGPIDQDDAKKLKKLKGAK